MGLRQWKLMLLGVGVGDGLRDHVVRSAVAAHHDEALPVSSLTELEVLRAVIILDTVQMMDRLVQLHRTPQFLLHHHDML